MCYTINIIAIAYQIYSVFQMIATGGCTRLKDEAEKGNSSQILLFGWSISFPSLVQPTSWLRAAQLDVCLAYLYEILLETAVSFTLSMF